MSQFVAEWLHMERSNHARLLYQLKRELQEQRTTPSPATTLTTPTIVPTTVPTTALTTESSDRSVAGSASPANTPHSSSHSSPSDNTPKLKQRVHYS